MEIKMSQEEAYRLIELCLEYDKDMSDYPERYDMALCIAREVFQKQVPVKPVYDHRYADMGCAFCGNSVGGWEESPDYCPQCGQAIDWEVREHCGAEIISKQDFTKAMDEIMAHIGIDTSTKSDFTPWRTAYHHSRNYTR